MKTLIMLVLSFIIVSCSSRTLISNNTTLNSTSSKVYFSKGSNESTHEAVVVHGAASLKEVLPAEYDYISNLYGQRGSNWSLMTQTIIKEKNRIFDVLEIKTNGSFDQRIIYFDISDVFSPDGDIPLCVK